MEKLPKAAKLKALKNKRNVLIALIAYTLVMVLILVLRETTFEKVIGVIMLSFYPIIVYLAYRLMIIYAKGYHKVMMKNSEDVVIVNNRYYIAVPELSKNKAVDCINCGLSGRCKPEIKCRANQRKDKQNVIFKRV